MMNELRKYFKDCMHVYDEIPSEAAEIIKNVSKEGVFSRFIHDKEAILKAKDACSERIEELKKEIEGNGGTKLLTSPGKASACYYISRQLVKIAHIYQVIFVLNGLQTVACGGNLDDFLSDRMLEEMKKYGTVFWE